MNRFLEATRSTFLLIGIIILTLLTTGTVTILNPISSVIIPPENQIAGIQDKKIERVNAVFKLSNPNLTQINAKVLSLQTTPTVVNKELGEIIISKISQDGTFTRISADIESSLKNQIRIELYDEMNTIVLKDFVKDFDSQKINFSNTNERKFKLRYFVKSPINFTSEVKLILE